MQQTADHSAQTDRTTWEDFYHREDSHLPPPPSCLFPKRTEEAKEEVGGWVEGDRGTALPVLAAVLGGGGGSL